MNLMKQMLVVLGLGGVLLIGACEDDAYGGPCSMDSDCRTGVGCWCEPAQRGETSGEWMGECPSQAGTCLSPTDFAAAQNRSPAE